MVALDEYGFRRLGHNGVVDQSLHHSRAMLEYIVGVLERIEEAHKDNMIDAMITRDGTLTLIRGSCHTI